MCLDGTIIGFSITWKHNTKTNNGNYKLEWTTWLKFRRKLSIIKHFFYTGAKYQILDIGEHTVDTKINQKVLIHIYPQTHLQGVTVR